MLQSSMIMIPFIEYVKLQKANKAPLVQVQEVVQIIPPIPIMDNQVQVEPAPQQEIISNPEFMQFSDVVKSRMSKPQRGSTRRQYDARVKKKFTNGVTRIVSQRAPLLQQMWQIFSNIDLMIKLTSHVL